VQVEIATPAMAELIDPNVQVERLCTGFTLIEEPDMEPAGLVPLIQRHAR
jgi:hypothetical protein